jgi:acyl-CoA synthetase (AMP-forming)/AMP-acid ligase II
MDVAGDVLYNGYGSSEVGIATLATPPDLRAAPGTVGRAVRGASICVLDRAGESVPAGVTGEIFVGGPMVFDGYTGGGGKPIVRGLASTGDVGHLDGAGRLFVEGRADDMIISGGENVFPQVAEDALARHDAVADVAVIGVPDREFGQRLHAFVVPRDPTLTGDALTTWLRGQLARYELPRAITLVDQLPRNATGKLLRARLRELVE